MNGQDEQEILCKTIAQKSGGSYKWEGGVCIVDTGFAKLKIGKDLTVDFTVQDPAKAPDVIKLIKEAYQEIKR